jgi:hypothetical protein
MAALCGVLFYVGVVDAAERSFASFASVRPILQALPSQVPPELRGADESRWIGWSRRRDEAIRARLEQGDLDSMVNLLLLGTSFTRQPRIRMETMTDAARSGVLRSRIDDLAAGLRNPRDNERLLFLRELLRRQRVDVDAPEAGSFLYKNLLRVMQERKRIAEQQARSGAAPPADPTSLLERSSLFENRGLSLDTSIIPNFGIEETLRDLMKHGVLRTGQVKRVGVIGPGLDFIDKREESAYDYYPPQTLQPFALTDSLARLGLGDSRSLSLTIFDISPRVIQHVQRARDRAAKGIGYMLQVPRDVGLTWPAELAAYWRSLGDQIGMEAVPIAPPALFGRLETRAVRIRPDVIRACEAVDLNIVLERQNRPEAQRFDLLVATNIFVYYDGFEQALALENAGAMLKRGGLLLTNDRLPEIPGGSVHLAGVTVISIDSAPQSMGWYQKQ